MGQKIKVKLSYLTYSTLISDMHVFEFYKNDGTVNKNLFLNTLIYKYSGIINSKIEAYNKDLRKMLTSYNIANDNVSNIIDYITALNNKVDNKENLDADLTFVVTSKFENVFEEIESNYLTNMNLSEYLRGLFNSYIKLNQDEREKVLFNDVVNYVNLAIKEKRKLIVKIRNAKHLTNPIGIFQSKDRKFSYYVYHINNIITSVRISKVQPLAMSKELIEEYVSDKNSKLAIKDFEFFGSATSDIKVQLTKKEIKLFNKIYTYRPIVKKIEDDIYYFDATADQVLFYFSRFGKEANVLNNESIRHRLYSFYKGGYNLYKEDCSKVNLGKIKKD